MEHLTEFFGQQCGGVASIAKMWQQGSADDDEIRGDRAAPRR